MTRILMVFGTRPEAIKMAPLVHELKRAPAFEVITCVTAQHREMLDQVLEWFEIKPDYDLDLMEPNQTLADLTARALIGTTGVMEATRPDVVLCQGDTTTAMTTALAAFYLSIPVGHVEAGLRTHNIYNPFPEEVNRHLISVMATYHFAPTETASEALLKEGASRGSIYITGNTVIDALLWTVAKPHRLTLPLLLDNPNEKMILVTAHRRESFGEEFESICHALRRIAGENPDARLVYPVHLNPNVQEPVYRLLNGVERIHLIEPLAYPDFAHLMNRAYLVITDSGGLQEEAPSLGKPVLVMRRTTERPEAVEAGTARLVGTNTDAIAEAAFELLNDENAYNRMANAISPFGDGKASQRIKEILSKDFG
nr:UDP-N-acetylglucosamine 2-epimerase (non-hydrolyzing) [Anaerolineae bacterium]